MTPTLQLRRGSEKSSRATRSDPAEPGSPWGGTRAHGPRPSRTPRLPRGSLVLEASASTPACSALAKQSPF